MRRFSSLTPCLWLSLVALAASANAVAASELADAAQRGDLAAVRNLLRGGADVNGTQGDGMASLHWAAERGDLELTSLLLYAGANPNAGTRIGNYTPLHIAARTGRGAIVEKLLSEGAASQAATTNSHVQAIHLAAASGSTQSVVALIAAGADVNTREGAWGQTPLTFAAAANRVDVLRTLLEAGADPSISSAVVDTADQERADKAAEKRLQQFLAEFKEKEGGDIDWQPSPSQVQAAIEASREIQRNWPDVPDPQEEEENASATVVYNADGEPIDDAAPAEGEAAKRATYGELVHAWGGLTPLLHAVRQGHHDAVEVLLDGGADINQASAGDGTTPLLMASINGQFDLALTLLHRGADPNRAATNGAAPLFAVLERQWAPRASYAHPTEHHRQAVTYLDVLRALLEADADPNRRLGRHLWYMEYTFSVLGAAGVHYAGATPFWRAAQALDLDAMRLLREFGADPNIATVKRPERRRSRNSEESAEDADDPSGLPPVPVGGPFIYPLHAAAGAGYGQYFAGNAHRYVPNNWLPAVAFLVEECGADVNLRDANGYTALHHAASRGDNALIEYLVARGADVMVVSRKGQTTADMANGPIQRVSPFPETIELLVSLGAKNNNNCLSC